MGSAGSTVISKAHNIKYKHYYCCLPIPVTVPSKALVGGRPVAGIVGKNPPGDIDVCLL
jgi:hypothetical protein